MIEVVGALDVIALRRSHPRLIEPGPSPDELTTLLTMAVCAPDHGRLRPWRFTVFAGEARERFGNVLAEGLRRREPGASADRLAIERSRLLRAPVVVGVAARVEPAPIPDAEQVAAVAAAVQNLLLAATALGYGSMWRTGQACTDATVRQALGLRRRDVLVGFVYLGTSEAPPAARPAPSLEGLVTTWR